MRWGRRKDRIVRGLSTGAKDIGKEAKRIAASERGKKIGKAAVAGVLVYIGTKALSKYADRKINEHYVNEIADALIKLESERLKRNTIFL